MKARFLRKALLWGPMALLAGMGGPVRAASITLDWNPVTQNADGTPLADLQSYRIFYATYPLAGLTTAQAVLAGGVTKVQAGNVTSFPLTGLSDGTSYYMRLTVLDASGNQSGWSAQSDGVTDLEVSAFTPAAVVVAPAGLTPPPGLKEAYAYPNPAKGVDPVIRAMMGGVDLVEITIFDQAGRAVKSDRVTSSVSVNGEIAYEYRWTGRKASGVYYAVIHGKKGNETVRARAGFAVVK